MVATILVNFFCFIGVYCVVFSGIVCNCLGCDVFAGGCADLPVLFLLWFWVVCGVEALHGQVVGVKPEADDDSSACFGEVGVMAVGFAGEYVGYVYFHHGCGDAPNGVGNGNGGVCVGAGVEHNAVVGEACCVEFVDDFAFVVGLEIADFYRGAIGLQLFQVVLKILMSVHGRLAFAEQIQVGAVDDKYFGHKLNFLQMYEFNTTFSVTGINNPAAKVFCAGVFLLCVGCSFRPGQRLVHAVGCACLPGVCRG